MAQQGMGMASETAAITVKSRAAELLMRARTWQEQVSRLDNIMAEAGISLVRKEAAVETDCPSDGSLTGVLTETVITNARAFGQFEALMERLSQEFT